MYKKITDNYTIYFSLFQRDAVIVQLFNTMKY